MEETLNNEITKVKQDNSGLKDKIA